MKKWVTTFSTHTNNRLPTPSKTQYDRLCLTHTSFCHTKLYSYVFSQLFLLVDIVTKSQWNFNIRIASVICKSSKSIQFKSFFFYKFRSNLQMQIHRPFLYLEIVHYQRTLHFGSVRSVIKFPLKDQLKDQLIICLYGTIPLKIPM